MRRTTAKNRYSRLQDAQALPNPVLQHGVLSREPRSDCLTAAMSAVYRSQQHVPSAAADWAQVGALCDRLHVNKEELVTCSPGENAKSLVELVLYAQDWQSALTIRAWVAPGLHCEGRVIRTLNCLALAENLRPHGPGVSVYENGAEYTGHYVNGVPHGFGQLEYPGGDKYIGEWQKGRQFGRGAIKSSTPGEPVLTGIFIDNEYCGDPEKLPTRKTLLEETKLAAQALLFARR